MVLDQLPAAKAQMRASGASEQDIRNFQSPILKFLVDAKREFGFVKGELKPRESCRTCRNTGDINDSIYDVKDKEVSQDIQLRLVE